MISSKFKLGDIITAYHKGYHQIYRIEKRKDTTPLLYYITIFDSNFKKYKKNKNQCCDEFYCKKVIIEELLTNAEKQHEEFAKRITELDEFIKNSIFIDWSSRNGH